MDDRERDANAELAFQAAKAAGGLVCLRKRLQSVAEGIYPGFTICYQPEVFHDYLTARAAIFPPVIRMILADDYLPQLVHHYAAMPLWERAVATWLARFVVCCQEHKAPRLPRRLPAQIREIIWAAAHQPAFSIGEEDPVGWAVFRYGFRTDLIALPEGQTSVECELGGTRLAYASADAQALVEDLLSHADRFEGPGGKALFLSCGELQRSWAVAEHAKAAVEGPPEAFTETLAKAVFLKGTLTRITLNAYFPQARSAAMTEAEAAAGLLRARLSTSEDGALSMFKVHWRRYRKRHGLPNWDEWIGGAGGAQPGGEK